MVNPTGQSSRSQLNPSFSQARYLHGTGAGNFNSILSGQHPMDLSQMHQQMQQQQAQQFQLQQQQLQASQQAGSQFSPTFPGVHPSMGAGMQGNNALVYIQG